MQSDESSPSFPNQDQEESKVAAPSHISGSAQKFLAAADANESDDNAYGVEAISVKADQVYSSNQTKLPAQAEEQKKGEALKPFNEAASRLAASPRRSQLNQEDAIPVPLSMIERSAEMESQLAEKDQIIAQMSA